ncbi:hypothetical protein BDK51DRAFT_32506, partial [Blyttiomyces helicus]
MPPQKQQPKPLPTPPLPALFIRFIALILILDGGSIAIHLFQYPALLILPVSRSLFRLYISFTERLFASLLVCTTYLFARTEIVLTGEHENLPARTVLMANHQLYRLGVDLFGVEA